MTEPTTEETGGRMEEMRKRSGLRLALGLAVALAALIVGLELAEKDAADDAAASSSAEPAHVEQIPGSELSRVTLTASAAERIGLETATVETRRAAVNGRAAQRKVVPYAAVLYDEHGKTWVYASAKPLEFLRAPIEVATIRGDLAVLSSGPPNGTKVASVGVAELYGTEFEVDH